MASLKARTVFGYHAAVLGLSFRDLESWCAQSVTMENNPSKAGVVRRIGLVGPLALGFDAEMRTGFLKSDFDLPAAHEPGENVAWSRAEIGGEKGLRFEFTFGIADEHPADRQRRDAASIPNCGAAGDLDDAVGSAVPETDAVALPGDFAILEDGGQLFAALALDRRRAPTFGLGGGKSNKLASRRKRG